MFSRFRTILLVFCPVVLAMVARASETSPHPYLALGDSVVFAFIDQAGFEYVNPENFVGFPDYVALGLRLKAFDAGCPGESTGSFLSATAPDNGCRLFRSLAPLHVAYSSTQSSFALDFLAKHRDTRLVSIMLGANDVFLLQNACAGNPTCIENGLPQVLAQIASNIGTILGEIRSTGYKGIIVVANYYSLDYTDVFGTEVATLLNQALASAAQAGGAVIADVFTAFQIAAANPFASGVPCKAGLLNASPQNQFTCDVHPSQSGHKLIAQAVEAAYAAAIGEKGD